MIIKKKTNFVIFLVLLAIGAIGLVLTQVKTDIPEEQTLEVQNNLATNCAQDIPREKIDDSVFNPEQRTVTVYWWDNELQDNVSLILPYEPETDFGGCSESAKQFLQHIRDTREDKD